jgi:tetratricopeptide (TPR) repeat protein
MTIINVYQELSEVVDNNIEALAEAASQEVSDPIDLTEEELIEAWGRPDNVEENEVNGVSTKNLSYGTIVVSVLNGRVETFLDANNEIGKRFAKSTKSITINKGVKSNLDNLFQPFASCEDLIKVFSAKMAETPDDVALLKRITTILDKKDCTDSKLFLDAAVKLNELEPSPEASYSLGIKFFKDKKWSDAATFFEQATKTENNDRRYRAYRNLGMCYQNMGSLSRARDIFRRSAQVDPTNGEPYLLIAMLYAESAKQFSGEIESKAVYWAAVDKCNKAKAIDPSCSEKANGLIRAYTAAFPSMETIFFNDYNEGQSFQVGGWIGETTTIRAKK